MMDSKNIHKIWVLDDGRAGTTNQALAVATALDMPFSVQKIIYSKLAKLPNFIRGRTSIGIASNTMADIQNKTLPDLIITAGRRALPFARFIKKKSNGKTKIVQIMYPGKFGIKDCSLVIVPNHDTKQPKGKNILYITGAPHLVFSSVIRKVAGKTNPEITKNPRPFTALIIGGSTKAKVFTKDMANELTAMVNKLTGGKGTILITTSRRTGKGNEDLIISKIQGNTYVYRWNDKAENPYFSYLALADRIIVTGDSVSMCCEASSMATPVYIYDNPDLLSKKHERFLNTIYKKGYAQPLSSFGLQHEDSKPMPNPAEQIASAIKNKVLPKESKE